jgi:activator of 2-hydroxyglutaryl-CoA dehydratase
MGEEKAFTFTALGEFMEKFEQQSKVFRDLDITKRIDHSHLLKVAPLQRNEQEAEILLELKKITGLLKEGNQTSKLLLVKMEELNIAISSASSREEAEGIVREALEKATEAKESIDTILAIGNYGKMLLKFFYNES